MTSTTTVMDSDAKPDPQVYVRRHVYDFNDLAEGVAQQLTTIIQAPAGCHYLNPAVTVSCSQPTPAFLRRGSAGAGPMVSNRQPNLPEAGTKECEDVGQL